MGKNQDEKTAPPAGASPPKPAASSPGTSPASPEAKKPSELEALRAKILEYENDVKRLAAEFDNYKKRVEREKSQAHAHGKAEAMAPFIDMAETFDHALSHAEKTDGSAMREGIRLLHQKLNSIFASMGVREIECRGRPNHAYHEVMLQVSGGPAGEIAQVLRKGYVMGEHVLRPAQVSVYMEENKEEGKAKGENEEKKEEGKEKEEKKEDENKNQKEKENEKGAKPQ